MEREKVRPLEKLPSRTKLIYCKLLSLMVTVEGELNQLKLAELYRLMANIKLPSSKREQIIEYIITPNKESLELICQAAINDLNQQEKNILRFSLMKDLMIIMGADYSESKEEREYISEIQKIYEITEEQLEFFKNEYRTDQVFTDLKDTKLFVKHTAAKAMAIGIPITAIYFSGTFKGLGPFGILSGLLGLSKMKSHKKESYLAGLVISIIMGFATYHSLKWIIDYNSKKNLKLQLLLKEEMRKIQDRGIRYISEDILSIDERIEDEKDTNLLIPLQELRLILEKTKGTLIHTEPHII
ncbi:hypothetical protein [Alkaliphilus peptidifermentans]|uniref:Tellurite resistance protein TerB n=1 Tax=Alkaliphilus peptidifermentans DSM 18978 TaxID=1120976 RepID=A0A1G5HLH0_9FIRM|nr:hypothetical protein [Alkaliphilus peptidifermentans]SCY64557.1 hypothetical protein SAMN03080606_02033 [Alkaliphilus peptidifermentans DSM 18978]